MQVSDFGISKATSTQTNTAKTANPNAKTAAGTTPWMAPEVLNGEPHTEKADVWAFAIVMGEILLRSTSPYGDKSQAQIINIFHDLEASNLDLIYQYQEARQQLEEVESESIRVRA